MSATDSPALPEPPQHLTRELRELLLDAIGSIDDYRAGLPFGSPDRKLLGRLKAALSADRTNPNPTT